jgi:DNA excision repair protein ERCC-6
MSGKLMVLQQILPVWKKQGHKVLIFTQTVQMLNILEHFISMSGYNYKRMDGNTIIKSRALIIKEFNENDDIFVFLLTTKVGGIGVNLTGADRVIIFDPDWNPSTDAQARERTWRIGQKRDVTVYRLITKGTIEEKIYHRQIWKQFLSSKVLSSNLSQTRSVFEMKGLKELFHLDNKGEITDTSILFKEATKEEKRKEQDQAEKGKTKQKGGLADETDNLLLKSLVGDSLSEMIDHDTLVGWEGKQSSRYEKSSTVKEAQQLAFLMAQKLRESREQIHGTPLSQPTWTGKRGTAGLPGATPPPTNKRKFGNVTNAHIMPTQIKINKTSEQVQLHSSHVVMSANPDSELITNIQSFLKERGGEASTSVIVQHFKNKIKPQQNDLFKQMLRQIAVFKKSESIWVLNDEFK